MGASEDFQLVMARLRGGDPDASEEIFRRYVRRLTALASSQFDSGTRYRVDPEGVVQSVYRSFFARDMRRPFELDGWERLWALLAVITIRKCSKKRRDWWGRTHGEEDWVEAIDRAPTPLEAAELTELVGRIFRSLEPEGREIAEGILQGLSAVEIAKRCDVCERTVRRVRTRIRDLVERLDPEESRI
jgi:DNA-directed RNA polymerase specialized sigma24 family protein